MERLIGCKSDTVQERIYLLLREDILHGVHSPGVQLKETSLCKLYNVSRCPLREAFYRLIGEGLLVTVPNRGVFVRRFTAKYINDVLNMREIMERRGVRNFVMTEERRTELLYMRAGARQLLDTQPFDIDAHTKFDAQVHFMFMGMNDNEYIDQLARQIYTLSTLFTIRMKTPASGIESETQHIELIDTLLSGDLQMAEKLIQKHVSRTKKLVREAMKKSEVDAKE